MKKLILLLVVMVGAVVHAQSPQGSTGRVGYADIQYIMSLLPEMKQIQTDMKSAETQFRNQIQTRTQTLQQQYNDFNEQSKSMVDSVRENRRRELQEAVADLQKFQEDAQVTLENKQKLYLAPLYLKVNKAIAEVARENGFAVILTDKINNYPMLLYKQPEDDVSDLVLKKFGVTPPAK